MTCDTRGLNSKFFSHAESVYYTKSEQQPRQYMALSICKIPSYAYSSLFPLPTQIYFKDIFGKSQKFSSFKILLVLVYFLPYFPLLGIFFSYESQ